MKGKLILITGGAGFIGSHLADQLIAQGHRVRVLDCLLPQVHGEARRRPAYLHPEVQLQIGDVRDAAAVRRALEGVDAVFHLAAAVGVGQSMYELAHYTSVNSLGTAVLLEALVLRPVQRLVLASSMSVYGEGLFRGPEGLIAAGGERTREQLQVGQWEVMDASGDVLTPMPTPETKPPSLSSVYALSKYDQERLCLMAGKAYGIPTVVLRLFNVYGTRQALSNPYTGVVANFSSRLLNGSAPLIFEDGLQRRDFVSVHDVVRACGLALEVPEAVGGVFNIGSGQAHSVREVAAAIAEIMGKPHLRPEITGKYRVGDVRHCVADISQARRVLGYSPQVSFHQGLTELAEWLRGQVATDRVAQARAELETRGLTV